MCDTANNKKRATVTIEGQGEECVKGGKKKALKVRKKRSSPPGSCAQTPQEKKNTQ